MSDKVKVEILGITNEPMPAVGCGCGPGTSCGPVGKAKTMGEVYEELVTFLKNTNLKDNIETHFIDFMEADLTNYDYVKKILEEGYSLPLTIINDQPIYAGEINDKKIYMTIQRLV